MKLPPRKKKQYSSIRAVRMSSSNVDVKAKEERERFREVYRKSLDFGEYVSPEDMSFVQNNMNKYEKEAEDILHSVQANMGYRANRETRDIIVNNPPSSHDYLKRKVSSLTKAEEGQYRLSPTLLYIGEMKMGLPNGSGCVIEINTTNGDKPTGNVIYEGCIENKLYNGKGKRYVDGYLYEDGIFERGVIREGVRYYSNGTLFSGTFIEGKRSNGRMVFPNGFFYSCRWEDDKPLNSVTASYPSATDKTTYKVGPESFVYYSDRVQIKQKDCWNIFYSNGDVFIGDITAKGIDNGALFKYNETTGTSFSRLEIGSVKVKVDGPEMVLYDTKYKSFRMKNKCVCLL